MTDSYTELLNAEREAEEEVYQPKPRHQEVKVNHTSETGRLVYEIIGRRAPPLFYAHCNNFISDMLQDGWQWWSIEAKLKDALIWVKKNNVNHAGLRTTLQKIRKEAK